MKLRDMELLRVAQLAENPWTPSAVLLDMTSDAHSPLVRWVLSQNDSLPADGVRNLLKDPEPDLALMLATRYQLPDDVLRSLATYPDLDVRKVIAARPLLPDDVVESLASEKNPEIDFLLKHKGNRFYLEGGEWHLRE